MRQTVSCVSCTSRASSELATAARRLVREYGLDRVAAPSEFMKLSLDLGVGVDKSLRIRSMIAEMR